MTTSRDDEAPVPDEGAWRSIGWTREEARRAAQAGLKFWFAQAWREKVPSITAEESLAWWACVSEDDGDFVGNYWVLRWLAAGVRHPDHRPPGMEPEDAMLCAIAGVPPTAQWGLGDRAICPGLMAVAHEQGVDPPLAGAVIDMLCKATADPGSGQCLHYLNEDWVKCGWHPAQSRQGVEFVRSLAGLDWQHVLDCLRSGMSPTQAREYVAAGADIEPVRLIGALR